MNVRRRLAAGVAVAVVSVALPAPALAQDAGERMRALLLDVQARTDRDHFYLSDRGLREALASFARLRPDAPPLLRWEAHLKLGEQEQHVGNEQGAIEHFESALSLLPEVEQDIAPEWIVRMYFRLGLAYLRFGETQNCALHHAPESCILPIRGSGIHVDPGPSREAVRHFSSLLALAPEGSDPYLSGRWLLNLAYMTVDGYPDEVPAAFLIPPGSFAADALFPSFRNRAMEAGVASFTLSGGVVVEDFDANGSLDLLVSSYDPGESLQLFLGTTDGGFVNRSARAQLTGILGGLNMVQGDYDNDGDMDVLVLRGAWLGSSGDHPNSLLRNNGDGTFSDITLDTALGETHYPTQTAAWADIDNDGDLDLYVGNETNDGHTAPAQLFENLGDATFRDIAAVAGVSNLRFTKGVVFGDFDADRDPDLFVSNLDGDNRLYRNRGDGTFEDVASELGLTTPRRSFPAWFWDYDNDGHLDLFVSAYQALISDLTSFHLGRGYAGETPKLYRGDGRGGFVDVSEAAGLAVPSAPMGANFGDLDNDGYLDFYLGTGYPPYFALMPNLMYWNRGGTRFDDVTTSGGFGHLQKGHAVAFADLDGDGDQDVFEQMGGALAGDRYNDVLYDNPGFGHHWLGIELAGVESNRAGVGARLRVDIIENGSARTIYKYVDSGGSFGANSVRRQMVGLGEAESLEAVEIYWPTTDQTQRFVDVAVDQWILVKEGLDRWIGIR